MPSKIVLDEDDDSSDPCEAAWGNTEMADADVSESESEGSSEESDESESSSEEDDDEVIIKKKVAPTKGGTPAKRTKRKGKSNDKKGKKKKKTYELPGQKRDTPEELHGKRIFYETLYKQNPNSQMAKLYLMEVGLLPEAEAKKMYNKVLKAKAMGKGLKHKSGKSRRAPKPKKQKRQRKQKKAAAYSDSDVASITSDDDSDWQAIKKQSKGKRKKRLGPPPSKIPTKRELALRRAAKGTKRKKTDVEAALRPKKKRKMLADSDSEDDKPLLVAKSG